MTRIGIVGAGAIGGWVGAKLAAAGEHDVRVLARGATLDALHARGLTLVEQGHATTHGVMASGDAAALGVCEVVFLAVKAPALSAAVAAALPMISAQTIVVPLLNGVPWWFLGETRPLRSVDPDGSIARAIPRAQLVGTVVHAASFVSAPGEVTLRMADRLIVGEPDGGPSGRVAEVSAMLAGAGLPGIASDDVRSEIWFKLWGNMTMNPLSALTLATMDRILDDALLNEFVVHCMEEAKAIGAHIGCVIDQTPHDRNAVTRKLGAVKTSMLQDVEAGRPIELDALVAAPREIARIHGIETPWIDALYGLTRVMAQSRGLLPS